LKLAEDDSINVEFLREPIYTDSRLLEKLYVDYGLGISEMVEVLNREMNHGRDETESAWNVSTSEIRDSLKEVELLESEDSLRYDEDDLRVGGPTVNVKSSEGDKGLRVKANDF
jgi:hypothetical protein